TLRSRQNLRFAAVLIGTFGLVLAFQNCGQSFNASKGSGADHTNLDLGYIPEADVNYNVRYDSSIQTSSTTTASTGAVTPDQLMAKLKYKSCMFNYLVTQPIEDFDEYINMLKRSDCESLPRAIE